MSIVKLANIYLKLPLGHVKADGKQFNQIKESAKNIQKNVEELKTDDKQAKKDHLIKSALENDNSGIAGFTNRHPLLTAGIALTGGIAAADAGLNLYKHVAEVKSFKGALKPTLHGLKEGAIYGGILSAVEPAILHGAFQKRED